VSSSVEHLLFGEEVITVKRMHHRRYGVLTILVIAAMALVVAPAASAKAESVTFTSYETYTPNLPSVTITGSVAHLYVENELTETSDNPLGVGTNHTQMHVVALHVVDGDVFTSTAGICYGTFYLDSDNGRFEGTFAGKFVASTGTYDLRATGKGVSGYVAGMVMRTHDVCEGGYGTAATATTTITAPHGF
jgi:hypothetical protein